MTEIKWQEPPPDGRSKTTRWTEVADALRSRPREWALVREDGDPAYASKIKRGQFVAFAPPGAFEATTRRNEDGKVDIYARYVGEGPR